MKFGIPEDKLNLFIGKQVHVLWAHRGCTWRLVRVEGQTAHLVTPRTGKSLRAHIKDLYPTRKNMSILQ